MMQNKVANADQSEAGEAAGVSPAVEDLSCVECHQLKCVRIRLRQCGHISCVRCLLEHLTFWIRNKSKARIKCIKTTCTTRIHENDINAVLDEQENGLDFFMPLDHRQWLQYYHNKDVIYYALGGNDQVKHCPLCKSVYVEREGCNYVTCANLRCRTRFCWQCGEPVESIMHFTGEKCRVGYDDIERSLFWVRLAIDVRAIALILYTPVFFLACIIGIPLFVFFAFPTFLAQRIYNNATEKSDYLTSMERIFVIFKMTSIAVASLPVALFLSLSSIATSLLVFAVYICFVILKITPYSKILDEGYDVFLPMAKKAGLGPFKQMLKDGKEAKKRHKQLLKEQAEKEVSERAEIVEVSSKNQESKNSSKVSPV
ncbi:hypothetical protein DICVIV_03256 [Dictyocaulus viviparus]|uniref:Uncharacterized protein n=1 Tax=Dictyocaulus viviparus TaxID=29172 RepID=A0A0D8Y326_DICVI|nr:hypothetical protein DICVIV_03256 [Dictyocaulus viviparus]